MTQPVTKSVPRYLRPQEKARKERRLAEYEKQASNPYLRSDVGRARLERAARSIRGDLAMQTAPVLSKTEEDRASKRRDMLQEQFTGQMLSSEEMRRNPVGAADHHLRWEKRNKAAIMEWKSLQVALHPGMSPEDSNDLCNVERFRPLTNPARNFNDAQIPRDIAYSMPPQHLGEKAGWPYRSFEELFDDSPDRVLSEERAAREALEAELEQLRAEKAEMAAKALEQERKQDKKTREEQEAIDRDRRRQASLQRAKEARAQED